MATKKDKVDEGVQASLENAIANSHPEETTLDEDAIAAASPPPVEEDKKK